MDTKLPTTPNVDELIVAIQALRPVCNQAEEEFARIYPAIKEGLAKGVTQKALMESGIVTQSKIRGLSAWTTQYTRAFAEVNDLMSVYNNPTSAEMLEKYPALTNFTNNR